MVWTKRMVTLVSRRRPRTSPQEGGGHGCQEGPGVFQDEAAGEALGVNGQAGDVHQAGDDHPGADEALFGETAFQEEDAAQGPLVAGEPAEKAGQGAAQGEKAWRQGEGGKGRVNLHQGEHDHEDRHHQLHRGYLEGAAQEVVGGQGGQVRQSEQNPGAQERRQERRQAEAQDHAGVGISTHQGQFEEVVGQVHERGEADGHLQGEKDGKDRQQESPQAEPRKKGKARGQEGRQGGEQVGEHAGQLNRGKLLGGDFYVSFAQQFQRRRQRTLLQALQTHRLAAGDVQLNLLGIDQKPVHRLDLVPEGGGQGEDRHRGVDGT